MPLDLAEHIGNRQRTAGAASLRDDAKGAGVVAAVLHGDEGAGVTPHFGALNGHVPGARIELGRVGDQAVHFGHGGQRGALHLGRAAGDQQPGLGPFSAGAADRLAGLAHGLCRNGAGIDDDQIAFLRQNAAQFLALRQVEPAAE